MRLYLKMSKNKSRIPFNYQSFLTGAIHKWMGPDNLEHGNLSLYSFSWLQSVRTSKDGIDILPESYFFISVHERVLAKSILNGITKDPSFFFGSEVTEAQIQETPSFGNRERFLVASPVFIKRRIDDKLVHITFESEKASDYLVETFQRKLKMAGLPTEGVNISFDKDYPYPKTKVINYRGIDNKVSICPVIIEGTPEQISFAWNVGIGNSTGIGFGSLK